MHAVRERRPRTGSNPPGVTSSVILLREELAAGSMHVLKELPLGTRTISLCAGQNALWVIIRRAGRGGLAMRCASFPAGYSKARITRRHAGEAARIEAESPVGIHRVSIALHKGAIPVLRVTTCLEPSMPLLTSFIPRDLYPLDDRDDPMDARGQVEAAQRGLNSGAIYFRQVEPDFGSVLYFQNLTALNDYFRATDTKPDGAVGGVWPEIGFLLPTPPQKGAAAGRSVPGRARDDDLRRPAGIPRRSGGRRAGNGAPLSLAARRSVPHVDRARPRIPRLGLARRAFAEAISTGSPKATIHHYGHRYLHPYTAAEYPDSMVQLSVLAAIRDYEVWTRKIVA